MPQGDSLRACYFDYPGLEDMMVWLSGLSGAHTYSIFAALSQAEARADRLARLFLLTDFGGKAPSLSWFNSGTTIWIWKKKAINIVFHVDGPIQTHMYAVPVFVQEPVPLDDVPAAQSSALPSGSWANTGSCCWGHGMLRGGLIQNSWCTVCCEIMTGLFFKRCMINIMKVIVN